MRLLIAILQEADAERSVNALTADGHRVTRLPSIGGFLAKPNVTLLVAVHDDDAYDGALRILATCSSSRDIELPPVLLGRLSDWQDAVVHHAGAVVFVVPLEAIVRL
jgi:uncharacterized protein YaaQ